MPEYPQTKQKTISYDSPSGFINIGKWVPPFEPVVGGFGYVGVLAEDSVSGKLQCHECGGWYELLSAHAAAAHGLINGKYQEKYGLSRSTALKCMRVRKIQSAVIQKLQREGKMAVGNNLGKSPIVKGNKYAANRKGKPKSVETQNKHGVCDVQMADRITQLATKLGRTPSLTEVIDEYGGGTASIIHSRYGSYITYVKKLGMTPLTSSYNPKHSRESLIQSGMNGVLNGGKLLAKKILTQSEQRKVYQIFGSWGAWKKAVLEEFKKEDSRTKQHHGS